MESTIQHDLPVLTELSASSGQIVACYERNYRLELDIVGNGHKTRVTKLRLYRRGKLWFEMNLLLDTGFDHPDNYTVTHRANDDATQTLVSLYLLSLVEEVRRNYRRRYPHKVVLALGGVINDLYCGINPER